MTASQQILLVTKAPFVVNLTGGSALYSGGDDFTFTNTMTVNSDGTITFSTVGPQQWGAPFSSGVGAGFWVRFTRTAFSTSGSGGSGSATGTTDWINLASPTSVSVNANKVSGVGSFITNATYTIEIATDSSGTNIVDTETGYQIRAIATISA